MVKLSEPKLLALEALHQFGPTITLSFHCITTSTASSLERDGFVLLQRRAKRGNATNVLVMTISRTGREVFAPYLERAMRQLAKLQRSREANPYVPEPSAGILIRLNYMTTICNSWRATAKGLRALERWASANETP